MSPTQRTLAYCRQRGWVCAVVEKWNPHAKVRQDLFGCIDIIALTDTNKTLGIQACAGASHAARRTKALAEPRLQDWFRCGNLFQVWSWAKQGARGKRKVWTVRHETLDPAVVTP